ncbi:MAG TPA: pyridoxamine 5'-phosphate oxidase family protein [Chloroflexi bacterium]|nr:pyridoxamine 5'-phosphate oxidase family protein [Chloroflexota bacterium]
MAKFYEELTPKLQDFIARQHIFFVATAPVDGRINLSPKGMDTFRVLDGGRVAFMNLTGSGNETAAHLADDGRITIMFCSFDEKPLILRLYGHAQAIHHYDQAWNDFVHLFPESAGNRNIILMTVHSVQSSCGFGVPLYEYLDERGTLAKTTEAKGKDGIQKYWVEKNQISIDGLPTYVLAE